MTTKHIHPRWIAGCLLATLAACGEYSSAPQPCTGIVLSQPAALTMTVKSSLATNIEDTVVFDPGISLSTDAGRDPVVVHSTTGHVEILPTRLRIYNSALPATTIPVVLFVRGASAGVDTLTLTTTFSGPQCRAGATVRVLATVTPTVTAP